MLCNIEGGVSLVDGEMLKDMYSVGGLCTEASIIAENINSGVKILLAKLGPNHSSKISMAAT